MNELLLEPLKYYETTGREKHKKNVSDYFEELTVRSGVDVVQNKKTVNEYNALMRKVQKLEKNLFWKKFLRVLLFVFAGIGTFLTVYGFATTLPVFILIGLVLAVLPLCLVFFVFNKSIKRFSETLEKERGEAHRLLEVAWQEMSALNALFDERDALRLIEKTIPVLTFDECYSSKREREICELCSYSPEYDENRSILDTICGEYKGNPFLFERCLIHHIENKVYHGQLTITWTERYRDSKGHYSTRLRAQTLHASVTKPKPFYHEDTVLKYFPQGAPDLSFTREGLYHDNKTDKQIEKLVKKGEKKLKKKTADAMEKGDSFTEMSNTEFEVLFDALNRDHEVQFRMMFTPLAQNNMVSLMRSNVGYGDDFDFYKSKRMTVIHSDHAQKWCMDTSKKQYCSYDFEEIKKKFQSFHEEYFKSVFFDFAPLLSIPMYQEKPVKSLEPISEYKINYTVNEYETLANRMEPSLLLAKQSGTRGILKARGLKRDKDIDKVEIQAFSYQAIPRTDFVPVLGGDGKIHPVPVHWTEYIPIKRTSYIEIGEQRADVDSKPSKDQRIVYHGLWANIISESK